MRYSIVLPVLGAAQTLAAANPDSYWKGWKSGNWGPTNDNKPSNVPYDPPIISTFHQADPAAHVWKCDPNTVWIYGSHDYNSTTASDDVGSQYAMKDYYVLSQKDITKNATISQKILDITDVPWVGRQLWAPDATEKDGKYYLFFPAKDKSDIFHIGVATSDTPDGKFKAEPNYIPGSYSIDPTILPDTDGNYYIYFGGLWGGQLQAWPNNTFNASAIGPTSPDYGYALGPRFAKLSKDLKSFDGPVEELIINDKDGKRMLANSTRRYFEAPSINKIGKNYWLTYSTGDSHTIEVSVANNPRGPFQWKSTLLQPVVGWTTHESIVKFKGDWLLYYADASYSHQDNLRNTKVRKLIVGDTISLQQPQPPTPSSAVKRSFHA